MTSVTSVTATMQHKTPSVLPSTGVTGPVISAARSALQSRLMPSRGLPQKHFKEIMQLQEHKKSGEKTSSVDVFFRRLRIPQMPNNPFTSQDLEKIYQMMSAYPMSNRIGFYTLFGLEFCALLHMLNTKPLESHLPDYKRDNITSQWQSYYIRFFFDVIQKNFPNPVDVMADTPSGKHNVVTYFNAELKRAFKEEFEIKINSTPQKLKKIQQSLYDRNVLPFLQKWNEVQQLFSKFLTHQNVRDLLYERTLLESPGIGEIMEFSTIPQMQQAGKYLCRYIQFAKKAVEPFSASFPEGLHMLEGVLAKLNPQMFDMPLDMKKITSNCTTIYYDLIKNIDSLKFVITAAGMESKKQSGVEACYTWIMRDLADIIYQSILPIADPLNKIRDLHEMRASVCLNQLAYEGAVLETGLHASFEEGACPVEFSSIYRDFKQQMINLEKHMLRYLAGVSYFTKNHHSLPGLILKEELEALFGKLNSITEPVLEKLSRCAEKHRSEMEQLPLLKMTQDLARLLVTIHDMEIVLNGKSSWACELPDSYLRLIALELEPEELPDVAALTEPVTLSPSYAAEVLPETENCSAQPMPPELDFTRFHLAVKESEEQILTANGSSAKPVSPPNAPSTEQALAADEPLKSQVSTIKPPKTKVSHVAKPQHAAPPNEGKTPPAEPSSQLFDAKSVSLRQMERVFKQLGLTRIEGANHAKWVDASGRVRTVMPRHGEISGGLLHAMQSQVSSASMAPNRSTPVLGSETVESQPASKAKKPGKHKKKA